MKRKHSVQVRCLDAGNANAALLDFSKVFAPRNCYAYIYVSNQNAEDVFFDNLSVNITTGNSIEEYHYFSFWPKIASISSKKLGDNGEGKLSNPYLYNGKEMLDEDAGLNWYDYSFRNYDPQIGRFVQPDPLTVEFPSLTPYQFASDDPITNVDLDGLESLNTTEQITNIAGKFSDGTSTVDALHNELPEVIVTGKRASSAAIKSSPTFLSTTGHFLLGVLKSGWGAVKGVVMTTMHPVETTVGILKAVVYLPSTVNALVTTVKKTYRDFKEGNRDTKAEISGEVLGNIVPLFFGVGEAKAGIEATELSKIATDAGELEQITGSGIGLQEAESLSETIKEIGNKFKSEAAGGGNEKVDFVVDNAAEGGTEGGLNLFKFGKPTTTTAEGWKTGDRMLKMFDQGSPKLNWKQNSGFLRQEMRSGNPIFDSYRLSNGQQIPTGGFLNAERKLLESRGWIYNSSTGAYHP